VPARVLRRRFTEETCQLLEDLAWWSWPENKIERNAAFFAIDCSTATVEDVRSALVG